MILCRLFVSLQFTVADGFARKKIYRVLSPCDRDYVNEVAMQTTDAVAMMGNAVNSYKVRLDEAVAMGDTLKAAGKAGCGLGEAEILTQLLPQVLNIVPIYAFFDIYRRCLHYLITCRPTLPVTPEHS